jgi:hypothetical protein
MNSGKLAQIKPLTLFIATSAGLFIGCSPVSFKQNTSLLPDSSLLITQPNTNTIGSYFFPIQNGKLTYQQVDLETNQTALSFQIQDNQGNHVNDITNQNLILTENGTEIRDYTMNANQQAIQHTADIILAVDVTGSMSPTIESAKLRLVNFIDNTRAQGYRTRMCVSTFGDYTVKHCNRFYNTDPNDPSSATEVTELKNEISQLRALVGVEDPGGTDFNENPMRALIDASNAPWASNSQRFVILITDHGFLFSPSNQGAVGALAPFMSEVRNAIENSQMRIFAVTPNLAGYNSSFNVRENGRNVTYPSIVQMSNGEHFLFSDLIAGRITLDTVLNRIISNILTTYQVNFIADENLGLSPHLPLNSRNFRIEVAGRPDLRVTMVSKSSNLPNGRQEYPKEWIITDKEIIEDSVKVYMNGNLVQNNQFSIHRNQVRFARAPQARAKLEIDYNYKHLSDSLALEPILLPVGTDIQSISVFINAVKAKKDDIRLVKNLEDQWIVQFTDKTLTQDTFKIRELGGASIQIFEAK